MKTKDEIQNEIISILPFKAHGLIKLPVRIGKTKIALEIIKKNDPKSILWVTSNSQLRDVDIPNEFKLWNCQNYLEITNIICYSSLSKFKGQYDLIILDEYQYLTDKNSLNLLTRELSFEYIIGLSGTHPKHLNKNLLYDKLNLKVIKDMSMREAIDKKLIAPYDIFLVECFLNHKVKNVKAGNREKPFFTTEQANYDYLTNRIEQSKIYGFIPKYLIMSRLRLIYNLESKTQRAKYLMNTLKGRTLVFAGSIEQAESLSKYTYHSKTDNKYLNMFLNEEIDHLVCVNAGGTGFTYKNVDNFIITQVNSNKRGDITQKIGRSLVLQGNYSAKIYVLYTKNTVDENWLSETLKDFDESKIKKYLYE